MSTINVALIFCAGIFSAYILWGLVSLLRSNTSKKENLDHPLLQNVFLISTGIVLCGFALVGFFVIAIFILRL